MAFCPYCGKEVSPQAVSCPNCGHPLRTPEVAKLSESVSGWWWLLPIFMAWVGGLITYVVFKDRNARAAKKMLVLGIVMSAVFYLVTLAIFAVLFRL